MNGVRRNALRAAIDNRVRLLVADASDIPPDEKQPCATELGRCGSRGAYKRGCRGPACRRFSADERAKIRKRATVSVHNVTGYKNGCRCDVCREDRNAYERNYRRERRLNGKKASLPETSSPEALPDRLTTQGA